MGRDNNYQRVENRVSTAFSDDQLIDALRDIFKHYGYDLAALSVSAKQEIANRLSEVAGRETPWEWRYVHNFMAHNIRAGQQFKSAIAGLAGIIDGAPLEIVRGKTVQILALGNVRPGSLVYGDSRPCANPACPIWFIPRSGNQRYHSADCRKADHRRSKQ